MLQVAQAVCVAYEAGIGKQKSRSERVWAEAPGEGGGLILKANLPHPSRLNYTILEWQQEISYNTEECGSCIISPLFSERMCMVHHSLRYVSLSPTAFFTYKLRQKILKKNMHLNLQIF